MSEKWDAMQGLFQSGMPSLKYMKDMFSFFCFYCMETRMALKLISMTVSNSSLMSTGLSRAAVLDARVTVDSTYISEVFLEKYSS